MTLGFGYDAANRRTSVTLPNGIVGTVGFDNANQLTSISYDGTGHVADVTYGYDAAGRRTSASGSLVRPILDSALPTVTYDAGNHMATVSGNALVYDANGNMTASPSPALNSLNWNARNQLTSTGNGSTFSYDALGRLVSQTSGSSTSTYLYDGLSQIVSNGSTMLRGTGPDDVHAHIAAGAAVSYLTDGLGSVAMLAGSTQVVSTQYSYSVYGVGASTAAGGPATSVTPFEYTGAVANSTDQLTYLRNRYYSPQLQRFVSEDPTRLGGGINTYAYASGNPVQLSDPLGLWVPPSIPEGVANAVTGFGDGIYRGLSFGFGDLNAFRNAIGVDGGIDICSSAYGNGSMTGTAWAVGTMWAAGLNGGANSVFWSGRGAAGLAEASGGIPIQNTAIGSLLNAAGVESRFIWSLASATYAANASGTATAILTEFNPEAMWTLEQAILDLRGVPIRVF